MRTRMGRRAGDRPQHPSCWLSAPRPAAVRDGLWVAALLYLVRLAGVWAGCSLGAGAGGTPHDVAKRLWMGMVTQVGGGGRRRAAGQHGLQACKHPPPPL